jgi:Arc/MetJ-type ribon-helix-helix transcriptional regulator
MSILSVPIPNNMLESINELIKQGIVANKAEAARRAIQLYLEDQAVKAVLKASKEPSLKGDLDELAKKI